MEKIDHKKTLKHLYLASAQQPCLIDVPAMNFLMIDGAGDPNTCAAYADAVEALFSVSYAIKFKIKKGPLAIDYAVMPLESLWWSKSGKPVSSMDKSQWQWTAMIMQPDVVTEALAHESIAEVARKKALRALSHLRFASYAEGKSAQVLHVGPFSSEGATVGRLHQFISTQGKPSGKHHEIYLSDVRRAAPEKWKTIIRQPLICG